MTITRAVAEYSWLVERIAVRLRRPGVEVDDLKQEGFFGLMTAVRTWREGAGSTFETWANQQIRSHLRTATGARRKSFDLVPFEDETTGSTPAEPLADALPTKLSDSDRALLALCCAGYTHAEIAERLGVARRTATDRIERAFETVRAA